MDARTSKQTWLVLILIILLLAGVGSVFSMARNLSNNKGYAPEQPIPFSHEIHAGKKQIPCGYCHLGIEKSKSAVVPPVNVCINCHQVVKTDSPHIKKLREHYASNQPIEWVKVHDLPDHVRFSHERHINAKIECSSCHGDVAKMQRVEQVKDLTMGFCLDCHRSEKVQAPTNCQSCHH